MKKILCIILSVFCILSLCSCGTTNGGYKNIEELSAKKTITYEVDELCTIYLDFKNNHLTVAFNVYRESSLSPSGVIKDHSKSETYEFDYTLKGCDRIYIKDNDKEYQYTILEGGHVRFEPDFLGVASYWT